MEAVALAGRVLVIEAGRIFSKTGTSKQAEPMILLRNSVPPVSAA